MSRAKDVLLAIGVVVALALAYAAYARSDHQLVGVCVVAEGIGDEYVTTLVDTPLSDGRTVQCANGHYVSAVPGDRHGA